MSSPFLESLRTGKPLIGMIHLAALPGTPRAQLAPAAIVERAVREAEIYRAAGIGTVLVENMHDVPYRKGVGPEAVAVAALAVAAVRRLGLTCGVQLLAGANREALAVAHAAGAAFVRVEGFAYGQIADEGYFDACAGDLLRYRREIGAEAVAVCPDIKKIHASHAITADVDLAETARTAAFFLADALIVTGSATGVPAAVADAQAVRAATPLPVLIGSGITAENLADYWPYADGFIVGSSVKEDGYWANPLSPARVAALVAARTKCEG
ncbi:MAG: BtpA/SgcQ family protein [Lentisphaeria bacterium]|jgi:membrane complex biogenesis BtpA family protein|nr:BtpA/SgcQ family protein [Lentisphaeria bacterium]